MLRNFHYAPSFDESHQETNPTARSAPPTAPALRPTVTVLRMICDALREGLAAHRRYEHLRSRGIPHDTAVRESVSGMLA